MRFHFTVRDLLWLILAVALAIGWWLNSGSIATQRDNALREVRDLTNTLDLYRAVSTSQPIAGGTSSVPLKRQGAAGDRVLPAN